MRVAGGRRKAVAPGMVVQASATPTASYLKNTVRFGFTASRKVGGAVVRNRAKRRLRALAQSALPELPGGHDLVLIARAATAERSHALLRKDLANCLAKLRLGAAGRQ